KIGVISTDANARTGELTPPGIKSTASLYASIDCEKSNYILSPYYLINHLATSLAKYVKINPAPARFIANNFSITIASSSIQPCIAAAFTMEYSPLTL